MMDFNMFVGEAVNEGRQQMEQAGYTQLQTPEEVDAALEKDGTTLVMVNSICGCAGGIARPAAEYAVQHDKRPDHLVTVFAGQDKEATARAREIFGAAHIPSSPSFTLLKDGEVVAEVRREEIEGFVPSQVVAKLQAYFDEHC